VPIPEDASAELRKIAFDPQFSRSTRPLGKEATFPRFHAMPATTTTPSSARRGRKPTATTRPTLTRQSHRSWIGWIMPA